MTFKGVVVDGVIVPGKDLRLPEGAEVEFELIRNKHRGGKAKASRTSSKAPKRPARQSRPKLRLLTPREQARLTKPQRIAMVLAAFGAWKDRPEWAGRSSAEIATELRRKAVQRALHG